MDLNHRSPGYEPDGISRLPHLAALTATVLPFQSTDNQKLTRSALNT
jgi:hypothetical protein